MNDRSCRPASNHIGDPSVLAVRRALASLVICFVAACSPGPPSVAPADASIGPSAAPTATTVEPTVTPGPTLPGGLAARPGLPPLVDGEAAACIPGCAVGRVEGGLLPAGRYQTEWFFGGYMTVETDGTWKRGEDSNGELGLPIAAPEGSAVYQVAFFLDPVLVVNDVVQDEIPREAAAYVEWLGTQPDLIVSEPIETRVGSVPALAVDIRLGPNAPSQYEDCPPDPCVTFIKVEAFDHSDGVFGNDEYRFYFADIAYSGSDHMLAVKVEGRDPDDLDSVLPKVEAVLDTVVIPARPAAPALVGTWLGLHNCERIVDVMTAAGMPEQGLLNVADSGTVPGVTTVDGFPDVRKPCVGAVDVRHSHFFTASGLFGSRDSHGQQVDDGQWRIVDADTFTINGTPFDYRVDGDELRMEAVDVGACPDPDEWCPEAWKLMVAMPGMAWERAGGT